METRPFAINCNKGENVFMKKNFIGILLFISLAAMMLFSGCYPTGERTLSNMGTSEFSQMVDKINSDSKHLSITAKVPENFPSSVPKINVQVMEWDEKKLNELFIAGRDDLTHYEYPSDDFPDRNYDAYMNENSEGDAYWLVYEAGRLTSEIRAEYNALGYGTIAASLPGHDFGKLFNDDAVTLFPKNDALKRAEALLSELGANNLSDPYIYAITAEKANIFIEDYNASIDEDEQKYQKWTVDDEIYILSYPIKYESIPVTMNSPQGFASDGIGLGFHFVIGSRIDLIVTKDEILSIDGSGLFSPKYEPGDTIKIKCTAQNALKIAAEYYESIALPGLDIEIKDCKLVYAPFERTDDTHFNLVPMWQIGMTLNYNDQRLLSPCDYLFIDVETGNIIIW